MASSRRIGTTLVDDVTFTTSPSLIGPFVYPVLRLSFGLRRRVYRARLAAPDRGGPPAQKSTPMIADRTGWPSMAFEHSMPDIVAASMHPALRVHSVQSPARYRFGNGAARGPVAGTESCRSPTARIALSA